MREISYLNVKLRLATTNGALSGVVGTNNFVSTTWFDSLNYTFRTFGDNKINHGRQIGVQIFVAVILLQELSNALGGVWMLHFQTIRNAFILNIFICNFYL